MENDRVLNDLWEKTDPPAMVRSSSSEKDQVGDARDLGEPDLFSGREQVDMCLLPN